VSVHPGTVATEIVELGGFMGTLQQHLSPLFLRSPASAAKAVLRAAFAPQPFGPPRAASGRNGCGECAPVAGAPGPAADPALADPWVRYANGKGVVLPPSGLALQPQVVDSFARALWMATRRALREALK